MLVVLGSINVDGVLSTQTLPRPGETVIGASYAIYPGGKGANQAVAAARFGARVEMVGRVGADPHGDFALDALAQAGVDTAGVARSAAPTAYASVWVDASGENQIIVASGANLDVRPDQADARRFSPAATLLLQLEIPTAVSAEVAGTAKRCGARVVLNAAPFVPSPPELLNQVDVLVVNEVEAAGLAQALGESSAGELEAARSLAQRFGLTCVLTRGAQGAIALEPAGAAWRVPALTLSPVDTTGAGDTFVGCLCAALDEGQSLGTALRAGSAAAGLACLELGAQSGMPRRDEVERALTELAELEPLQA